MPSIEDIINSLNFQLLRNADEVGMMIEKLRKALVDKDETQIQMSLSEIPICVEHMIRNPTRRVIGKLKVHSKICSALNIELQRLVP